MQPLAGAGPSVRGGDVASWPDGGRGDPSLRGSPILTDRSPTSHIFREGSPPQHLHVSDGGGRGQRLQICACLFYPCPECQA